MAELDPPAQGALLSEPIAPADPAVWREWAERVHDAAARGACLRVRGGGSKDHLGDTTRGELLDTRDCQGIVAYEPSELVIRARAGTPLAEVETALAERGQHLAFEPPRFAFHADGSGAGAGAATLGGVVASGLSGPGRVSRGAVRDHVLGCTLMNGRAEVMRFGGAVMKNVAGFDLSRLMAGSMGTLGLLLEVTLKVMPQPVVSATMRFEMPQAEALAQVNQWAAQPLPLDASAWWDGLLVLRLRGARAAVASAVQRLYRERRGELLAPPVADAFWQGMRDQSDEFFQRARQAVAQAGGQGVALWRLSVPPTTAPLEVHGEQLIEWFGGQRWVCTPAPAAAVHALAARVGGHAQAVCSAQPLPCVDEAALSPVLLRLHRQVQRAFDPQGVFATGRLLPLSA
ncbi:glycolate oxidase FAD binding subunit [Aquabacterium commune]|uniref:Glycolate oxidase FAD binding subunit n=1 Tax=Aquabacterium commune TaxID=70586 RepID=A0A4R6R836_9BURK|nr:glycolate oxidase subunit GlcE [Aquabacterium commune]TDP81746.1 glycolate oxidase FAD binding subunit [Aquabacterium commune]